MNTMADLLVVRKVLGKPFGRTHYVASSSVHYDVSFSSIATILY